MFSAEHDQMATILDEINKKIKLLQSDFDWLIAEKRANRPDTSAEAEQRAGKIDAKLQENAALLFLWRQLDILAKHIQVTSSKDQAGQLVNMRAYIDILEQHIVYAPLVCRDMISLAEEMRQHQSQLSSPSSAPSLPVITPAELSSSVNVDRESFYLYKTLTQLRRLATGEVVLEGGTLDLLDKNITRVEKELADLKEQQRQVREQLQVKERVGLLHKHDERYPSQLKAKQQELEAVAAKIAERQATLFILQQFLILKEDAQSCRVGQFNQYVNINQQLKTLAEAMKTRETLDDSDHIKFICRQLREAWQEVGRALQREPQQIPLAESEAMISMLGRLHCIAQMPVERQQVLPPIIKARPAAAPIDGRRSQLTPLPSVVPLSKVGHAKKKHPRELSPMPVRPAVVVEPPEQQPQSHHQGGFLGRRRKPHHLPPLQAEQQKNRQQRKPGRS